MSLGLVCGFVFDSDMDVCKLSDFTLERSHGVFCTSLKKIQKNTKKIQKKDSSARNQSTNQPVHTDSVFIGFLYFLNFPDEP